MRMRQLLTKLQAEPNLNVRCNCMVALRGWQTSENMSQSDNIDCQT